MRRLLVTGGAGFIGANFVHHWINQYAGERVIVLDALTYAGNLRNLDEVKHRDEFRFVRGDIGDTDLVEKLLREERIDTVVHFAAESHVDRSIHGPDAFVQTNVIGTHSLLKEARKVWLDEKSVSQHRFHHVSTDEVYGSLSLTDAAFSEATPYAPNSPYSASKAASDHLVRAYHHTYGLNVTTSNCSNNYGPYHFPEKLIPLVILNALEGKPLPVYGDGKQIRDWLFVDDHARALLTVVEKGKIGETYNIGGHNEKENIAVVRTICNILEELHPEKPSGLVNYQDLIKFVKDRPGHDLRYAIDAGKIANELGWTPKETFETGLKKTVEWYLDNLDWCRHVQDGSYRRERLGLGEDE